MGHALNRMIVFSAVFHLLFAGLAAAEDMALDLDNGETVLLHEDQTWDYTSKQAAKLKEDVTIMLDDGTSVKVKKNKTWYNVENQAGPVADESTSLGTAYSTGTAEGTDLAGAKISAMKQAAIHLAKQVYQAAGCAQCTLDGVIKCIEQEDKGMDIQEKPGDKNTWRVQVFLSLNAEQIKYVIECAEIESR